MASSRAQIGRRSSRATMSLMQPCKFFWKHLERSSSPVQNGCGARIRKLKNYPLMPNSSLRFSWSIRKNSKNLQGKRISAHSVAWITSLDHGWRTTGRMWPMMHSYWESLTSGAYQTSCKSIKLQHRSHTSRTSRMRFKDNLNPQSMNLQSGFGFVGQRRLRFTSQLLRTSQCSRMYTYSVCGLLAYK